MPKPTTARNDAAFQHDRTSGNDEWLTPRAILDAFDMPRLADVDPCAPLRQPWPTARRCLTVRDDGLAHAWDRKEFYFTNPPYGRECPAWMARAADHGNGLVLVFARTETRMWHESVWRHPNTSAVFFFEGRLRFVTRKGEEVGSAGAPSALVAYGAKAKRALIKAVRGGTLRGRILLLDDAQAGVFRLGRAA